MPDEMPDHTPDARSDTDLIVAPADILTWRGESYACAAGWGGIKRDKREGDGATPIGCFPLRRVLYRPDRLAPPKTALPIAPLNPRDGWCDDPSDLLYNQQIRQPFDANCEQLWRSDSLYDVIVVLGFNDDPVVKGKGSAIFLHVAAPAYASTEGCVALAKGHLLHILEHCEPRARLCVNAL